MNFESKCSCQNFLLLPCKCIEISCGLRHPEEAVGPRPYLPVPLPCLVFTSCSPLALLDFSSCFKQGATLRNYDSSVPGLEVAINQQSLVTCQIDSKEVSISKLQPDLCNCVNLRQFQLQLLAAATRMYFYKKLRIWASTESFLRLSDFEHSELLTCFLKAP